MSSPPPQQPPTATDLLVAITRVETKLDVVTQQGADHETRLRTVEQTTVTQGDLDPIRADIESLKRSRWPLASVGALAGVGGAIAAVVALFHA